MKIISLLDNLVYKQGLKAEHGLSFLLEIEDKRILFDTGQSDLFLHNATKLGILPETIDAVILSHGHYDHTGGLYPFLRENTKAKVFAKEAIFTPKYHGRERFIGCTKDDSILRNRFVPIHSVTELFPNLFIMPDIPISLNNDTHFKHFFVRPHDELIPDEFNDELFLVITRNHQINIITACSHRGITNICSAATQQFALPVNLIIGGFHTKESTLEQYNTIVKYMRQLQPRAIGVCHCTGVEKYADLRYDCDAKVFYHYTGHECLL